MRSTCPHTIVENGTIPTLCRQCDMRCGIEVHIRDGAIKRVRGLAGHPQNQGRICVKATVAAETVCHPQRLRHCLKRRADGRFQPIAADRAMDEIAAAMQDIAGRDGARSLGVWTGEAIGFFQQADYARRFVHAFGSPNYFSAESVCFASRCMAAVLTQGFFNQIPDFANARLIVLWGINPEVTHLPYQIAIAAARNKGATIVVIDPQRSTAARAANLWLRPRPGTDGALAWGLACHLIETSGHDADFVARWSTGFEAYRAYARQFTPQATAALTGVGADQVEALGRMMADARPAVVNCAGISLEHCANGFNNLRAVACLAGLLGSVDTRGGEFWPEPPQARPLHLYDELPLDHLEPVGADRFPLLYAMRRECHSMTAMDRMLGNGGYRLAGLIITGANPVLTNPNSAKIVQALSALDLLVVRDLFLTPTARLAHYVLPAASFLERSDLHWYPHLQHVALSRPVMTWPGAEDEYSFWRSLACRLGLAQRYFPWQDEDQVNAWILEGSGIGLDRLARHPEGLSYAPIQTEKYRHRPFATASGKFAFCADTLADHGYCALPEYRPPAYLNQHDYPLALVSGVRRRRFCHSRLFNIPHFQKAAQSTALQFNPSTAAAAGLVDGQQARLVSSISTIDVSVAVTEPDAILAGVVLLAHGLEQPNVNQLTDDSDVDPVSGLPNLRTVPVRLEKPDV